MDLKMMKPIPRDFAPVRSNLQALEREPQHFEALMGRGAFYRKAEFVPVAHDFYDRALKSSSAREDALARDEVRIRIALGMLALAANDTREVLRVSEKACKECDPSTRGSLGPT